MTTTTRRTLADLAAEVHTVNVEKGWFDTDRSYAEGIALIHSEISEALEAFRDHGIEDATGPGEALWDEDHMGNNTIPAGHKPAKPEGVGSEMADIIIRVLDMATRHKVNPDTARSVSALSVTLMGGSTEIDKAMGETFGDACAFLHHILGTPDPTHVCESCTSSLVGMMLVAVGHVCHKFDIDIQDEYDRKIAYNRTRPYRHGGRAL